MLGQKNHFEFSYCSSEHLAFVMMIYQSQITFLLHNVRSVVNLSRYIIKFLSVIEISVMSYAILQHIRPNLLWKEAWGWGNIFVAICRLSRSVLKIKLLCHSVVFNLCMLLTKTRIPSY